MSAVALHTLGSNDNCIVTADKMTFQLHKISRRWITFS